MSTQPIPRSERGLRNQHRNAGIQHRVSYSPGHKWRRAEASDGKGARGSSRAFRALAGTFLVSAVALFPRRELSGWRRHSRNHAISSAAPRCVCVTQLGRSFSVMAEARDWSPRAYTDRATPALRGEEIAAIGLAIQFLSYQTLLLLVVHAGLPAATDAE